MRYGFGSVSPASHLRVWNLPRVRERLAAMNLDWDLPPEPPAPEPKPVGTITVIPGELKPAAKP